jgi:hypothetical protein
LRTHSSAQRHEDYPDNGLDGLAQMGLEHSKFSQAGAGSQQFGATEFPNAQICPRMIPFPNSVF